MNLSNFTKIDRSKHFEAIQINKELQVETINDKESGLRYFVIKNVLKDPDAFVELLSKHNAYGGDIEVSIPGYRQLISSLEVPTISKLYAQLFKEFTDVETKLSSWYYATNIFHQDMVSAKANNMPRFEPYPIATQLCLTKDPNCGLVFFKVGGHARYNNEVKEFEQDVFDKVFPAFNPKTEKNIQSWKNFEGNEDWTPYVQEKYEYNSAIVFDPLYFHQVLFAENKVDSVKYFLTSYLDAPIVEFPFWQASDKFDETENNLTPTVISDII